MNEGGSMSTDVAVRERGQQMAVLTNEQLQFIAGTEFVPPGLRGNLPAILACVATGRALGIADMSALRSIHIIDGKATFSAELMVQLVRRAGHSIVGETTDGSATVTGTRADNGDTMTVTWTTGMAERAGLLGKSNWKKYPEAMLWARAASQLCRMLFADCFAGATYTPEELDDGVVAPEREPERGPSGGGNSVPPATDSAAPTGEQPSRSEKPITDPQKKKANVLVGTLRDALRLTTEEVYLAADRPIPELGEGETLHWSPLRDSLTKSEASLLIDRLEKYDASEATSPPIEEWVAGEGAAAHSPVPAVAPADSTLASEVQKRMLVEAAERHGLDGNQARAVLSAAAGVQSLADLPAAQVDAVFEALRAAGKTAA